MAAIDFENDILVTKQNLNKALRNTKTYVDAQDTAINNIIGNYPSMEDTEVEGVVVAGAKSVAERLALLEGNNTSAAAEIETLSATLETLTDDVDDLKDALGDYPSTDPTQVPATWTITNDENPNIVATVDDYSKLPPEGDDREAADGDVYAVTNSYTDPDTGVEYPAGNYTFSSSTTTPGAQTVAQRLDTIESDLDSMDEDIAALEQRIENLDLFTKKILTELPALDDAEPNVLYIVPNTSDDATAENAYLEYVLVDASKKLKDDYEGDPADATDADYVDVPARFEIVGQASEKIDLSGYSTTEEVAQMIEDAEYDDTEVKTDITTIKLQIGNYPTSTVTENDGTWTKLDELGENTVTSTVDSYSDLPMRGVAENAVYETTNAYTDDETSTEYAAGYYQFTPSIATTPNKSIATRLDDIETKVGEINVMTDEEVETLCDDIFGTTVTTDPEDPENP